MKPEEIDKIRGFNRFYTKIIGLLNRQILNSEYSLPEVRVLFELNENPGLTASDIITALDIDKGYLSRILKKFEKKALIQRKPSKSDKRTTYLSLSKSGKSEFKKLDQASASQINDIFFSHTDKEISELTTKMNEITQLIHRNPCD